MALLYGSTADICEAKWKTISLDNIPTAKSAFQCKWSSVADQNEGHLKIRLFMLWFHHVLWCGKSLNYPKPEQYTQIAWIWSLTCTVFNPLSCKLTTGRSLAMLQRGSRMSVSVSQSTTFVQTEILTMELNLLMFSHVPAAGQSFHLSSKISQHLQSELVQTFCFVKPNDLVTPISPLGPRRGSHLRFWVTYFNNCWTDCHDICCNYSWCPENELQ